MSYQGLYINLDRCTERRAAMEAELMRYGLTQHYKRLRGADGNEANIHSPLANAGEIGCFLSHIGALREGMKTGEHLHIVEDDTLFAACTAPTLEWALSSGVADAYDILYTDIAMPLANDSYRLFKNMFDRCVKRDAGGTIIGAEFQAIDLSSVEFLTTSSYLVHKKSLKKLHALYEEEYAAGLRLPIDLFFRNHAKVGSLKIGCLFPFVTSARVEETLTSTVRLRPDASRRFTAANLGRYSFFVGCDWDECQRLLDAHIPPLPVTDRHAQLLAQLLGFSLMAEESFTP